MNYSFYPKRTVRHIALVAISAVALIAAILSPLQTSAAPTPFRTATGTANAVVDDTFTLAGMIGDITVYTEVINFYYAGDLVGLATDHNTLFVHPDGHFQTHAREMSGSATLGGRTGGFTAQYVIVGEDFFSPTSPGPNYHYNGYLVFTGGTGGLAGLRGGGTFAYDGVNGSTYSYQYRFTR